MTEIIAEAAPRAIPAILSGPSFADDVARGLPTAVTLAAADETIAADLAQALGSATFRPYHSTDLRGVEIGGAAKNVLAIATGIVSGRGLGASAAAALVTRGFAELVRFGRKLGARPETLTGLSGLGDLVLTCSSRAIAQLLARACRSAKACRRRGAESDQARRRRLHRVGAGRDGEGAQRRHADHRRRRRRARRHHECRRSDRLADDTAFPRGITMSKIKAALFYNYPSAIEGEVFGQGRRERIAALTELYPHVVHAGNFDEHAGKARRHRGDLRAPGA